MRYRANARVVSKAGKEIGRVNYIVKAKNKSGAMAKLRKLFNARPHKKNGTFEGFKDQYGQVHPIRGGKGYSQREVDKAAARKRTRRARRGRQAIS